MIVRRRVHRLRDISLTTRVFLGTAAVVVTVVVTAFVSVAISVRQASDIAARRALEQSADLVAQFLAGRARTLEGGARVFVQGPYFRTLVAERRRDDVLDRAFEAAEQIDADWVFITDENGVLIAKSDEPGVTGIPMGQVPLVAGALRGQVTNGFGASGDSVVFQAVAVPIVANLGAPAGVLVATRVIDSLFVNDVKAATASELVFFSRDERGEAHAAAATLGPPDALTLLLSMVSSTSREPAPPRGEVHRGGGAERGAESRVKFADADYVARGTSLSTAGGDVVGGFLVLRTHDGAVSNLAGVRGPLLVAVSVGLLVALLAALAAARFVTRPVRALADAVTSAADGDLTEPVRLANRAEGVREIRELASAFESLLSDLRDKEALIAVAAGDAIADDDKDAATITTTRSARAVGSRTSRLSPQPLQIIRPGLVLSAGSVLANRYLIEAELGRGGLGIVYRARDRVLAETIAIKMLRPEVVASDPGAFERLKSELRVTRLLSHRNIVRTHDIGEAEESPFFTMEYVDGASLSTIVHARGRLGGPAVLSVAKQLMRALAVAHDHGIVHGDLKPQNLLIGSNGLLKVTDFGVARLVRGARSARTAEGSHGGASGAGTSNEPNSTGGSLPRLTGAVLGTPEYMAPEQLIGEPSSERTDIYAAGIVLQECLDGSTPYSADTPVAFVARKLHPDDIDARSPFVQSTSSSDAFTSVRRIIERMMDPRVETRPSSASDVLAQFVALG